VKLLVADDHPLIREAFRHLLAELAPGASVLEAGNCETIRRLAMEHPDIDLLLLDLRLPGPGGLATLDALRKDNPAIPVVVVSAVEDPGVVRTVLAHGAMGFIPKSSSNEVMLNALRLVLSGGRYLPADLLATDGGISQTGPANPEELHLTDRQCEVLALMVQGKSNKLICRELGLAEATVKIHVTAILRALRVTSRAQAIVAINQLGLTPDSLLSGVLRN
jgi:DNA-binding NarL/FixJ family response regulator